MKFIVRHTSAGRITGEVDISTLEELLEFTKSEGGRVIVFTATDIYPLQIEVYDDWRE